MQFIYVHSDVRIYSTNITKNFHPKFRFPAIIKNNPKN